MSFLLKHEICIRSQSDLLKKFLHDYLIFATLIVIRPIIRTVYYRHEVIHIASIPQRLRVQGRNLGKFDQFLSAGVVS